MGKQVAESCVYAARLGCGPGTRTGDAQGYHAHVMTDGDSPGGGRLGDAAVHSEERRYLQVGRGGRPHTRHTLQQLTEDAAQGPHVDGCCVAAPGHNHLRQSPAQNIDN